MRGLGSRDGGSAVASHTHTHTRYFAAAVGLVLSIMLTPVRASAWIFPEHTEITARALAALEDPATPPVMRAVLLTVVDALKLCDGAATPEMCPTLSVLPSLAGDHSCKPSELRADIQGVGTKAGHWVLGVLEVAAHTGDKLRVAGPDAAERADIRRQMHIDMQGQDALYVQRAQLGATHFQLAREDGRLDDLAAYLDLALASAREPNATAAYASYHVAAVRLAAEARVATAKRTDLLVRAFLTEAFALHFLEDSFSAGHIVGHWGDHATQLGTHDFYSGHGIETQRWRDPASTYVAHGDAFLTDGEARFAATAVLASLRQLLVAATDARGGEALLLSFRGALGVEEYDSCNDPVVTPSLASLAHAAPIHEVLGFEPIPAPRYPAVARVRAEQGFFFGGAAGFEGGYWSGENVVDARVRATGRIGYGAAGIVDDPINAQAFLDVGIFGEYLTSSPGVDVIGLTARLRAPGYLALPDGLIAILLAETLEAQCPFCVNWAASAAGGGLGRLWRSRALAGSVSWQLSALRDATLDIFRGSGFYRTELLTPFLTARSALPIAGSGLSQSTDVYLDLGPSLVWSSGHPFASPGAFLSLSACTRLFP